MDKNWRLQSKRITLSLPVEQRGGSKLVLKIVLTVILRKTICWCHIFWILVNFSASNECFIAALSIFWLIIHVDVVYPERERDINLENKNPYTDSSASPYSSCYSLTVMLLYSTSGKAISVSSVRSSHCLSWVKTFSSTACTRGPANAKLSAFSLSSPSIFVQLWQIIFLCFPKFSFTLRPP